MRPAREALFTAVERESRYKAKNVLDTVVSRAGDALGAWMHAVAGLGTPGVALAAIPGALVLAWLGMKLGRHYQRQVAQTAAASGMDEVDTGARLATRAAK